MATRTLLVICIALSYLLYDNVTTESYYRNDYVWALGRIKDLECAVISNQESIMILRQELLQCSRAAEARIAKGTITDEEWKALCVVESQDGETSDNVAQITKICIADVNRIASKNFKLSDRKDPVKSREIFDIYTTYYLGDDAIFEDRARVWSGGPEGHKNHSTDRYWSKIREQLK